MLSWQPLRLLRWPTCCTILLIFSVFVPGTLAQDSSDFGLAPSNDTGLLPTFGHVPFYLNSPQLHLSINLAPLTLRLSSLVSTDVQHLAGNYSLVSVTPSNSASSFNQQITLISCDPYSGNIDATETLSNVLSTVSRPAAIILYSTQSQFCSVTDLPDDYVYLFTIVGFNYSIELLQHLKTSPNANMTSIFPMTTTTSSAPTTTSTSASSQGGNSLPNASPTTAVAMIILYSITGVITALFLGIIVSGAIRAHRHPERYGPRNVIGRPRQSRAKGLARAMLETIPIVKFGDREPNPSVPPKGDVELASAHEGEGLETHGNDRRSAGNGEDITRSTSCPPTSTSGEEITEHHRESVVQTGQAASNPEFAQDLGNHICPICTDDFEKGQDVRVLPCNHQFHPTCVDPWLINVSGTCPLCRIDLNPAAAEAEEEGNTEGEQAQSVEEPPVATSSTYISRRSSGSLSDPRRIRNAPVEERIAALRQLRRASTTGDEEQTNESTEERQRRMGRLAQRLRERFRIRTRRHGEQPPTSTDPAPPPHST